MALFCVDVRMQSATGRRCPDEEVGRLLSDDQASAWERSHERSRRRRAAEDGMNGTVLIVNDDVNQRIIEETLLQARGLPVRTLGDGGDACDLLVRDGARIAVVVMSLDLNATGMNGWELLRHLRGRFDPTPLAVQPRIVVTTSRDAPTARFAARLGADVVLQRPIAPRDFIGAVERLLHRSQTALAAAAACR